MKRAILTIIAVLCLTASVQAEIGVTLWGLTEQDFGGANAITGRIGYQLGNIEAFVGSTWAPKYKEGTREMEPPQVFSVGALYHYVDLLDVNSPMPWIPDVLLMVIPEDVVIQPYFGVQGTYNIVDTDAGFFGEIVGLQLKAKAEDKSSFIIEAQYNNAFNDLAGRNENQLVMYAGARFLF